jgi:hypothetical protein
MGLEALAGLRSAVGVGGRMADAISEQLNKQKKLKAWKDVSDTVERLRQAKAAPETEPSNITAPETPTDTVTPTPAKAKDLGLNILEGNKAGIDTSDTGSDFTSPVDTKPAADKTEAPSIKPEPAKTDATSTPEAVKPPDIKAAAAKAIAPKPANDMQGLMDEESLWREAIRQNPLGADHPAYKALQDNLKSAMGYGGLMNKQALTENKTELNRANVEKIKQDMDLAQKKFGPEVEALMAKTGLNQASAQLAIANEHFKTLQADDVSALNESLIGLRNAQAGAATKNADTNAMKAAKAGGATGGPLAGFKPEQIQKGWVQLGHDVNALGATSRKALGVAANANMRADRALERLSPNMTPEDKDLVVTDIMGLMKGGSPDEIQIKRGMYNTLSQEATALLERVIGDPTALNNPEVLDKLKETVTSIKEIDNNVIKRNLGINAIMYEPFIKADPGRFQRLTNAIMETTLAPGEKAKEATATPTTETPGAGETPEQKIARLKAGGAIK